MFPCDDKAAYRRWSNLKVPVIARKVEACILRCMWLVRLNPKAELTNEKKGCHWKVLNKNKRLNHWHFPQTAPIGSAALEWFVLTGSG